jgi:hypothetical protein
MSAKITLPGGHANFSVPEQNEISIAFLSHLLDDYFHNPIAFAQTFLYDCPTIS